MRKLPCRARVQERGQALVEVIVVALFFLVPLFLAVVALGKFIDVQHTTNVASRYAAWERTVWYENGGGQEFNNFNAPNRKTASQIHAELAVRVFNDRSQNVTVIKDTDKNATTFANGIDPMWRDNADVPYLRDFSQANTAIAMSAPSRDVTGTALRAFSSLPLPPGVVGTLAPPLPTESMATATVTLREVARNSQAYQRLWPRTGVWVDEWLGLDFTSTGAILSNTWGANGSRGTRDMVAMSVPTAQGLGSLLETSANVSIRTWDPLMSNIDLGKISPDVVPGDRLR